MYVCIYMYIYTHTHLPAAVVTHPSDRRTKLPTKPLC